MSKVCSKCNEQLDLNNFSCTKRNEDGSCKYYNSWCNPCRTKSNRDRSGVTIRPKALLTEDTKQCLICLNSLPFKAFSPSARGKLGLSAYCKNCTNIKYKVDKVKARGRTQKYRDNNKEVWREKHRLNMFKRRQGIEAACDGTVTKAFIVSIYKIEICYWCKQFTPENLRTLEHVKELNNGGLHSIYNITMACRSCNSARRNKDDKHQRQDHC